MPIETIGLKVESSGVATAIDRLDDFAASGKKAETAADSLGKKASEAAGKVGGLASETGKAGAATDKFSAAQQRGARQVNDYGLSVKQQQAAMRLLPAQITDIVTSLISGQPAYLVAIQQGGQLKDSFGGIVPAARALLGAISPLTLGIGAVGVGLATIFTGIAQGQAEQTEFTRSLILTGGVAGVTAGELGRMAGAIDQIAGTRANAAEVLNLLVSTGQVGSQNLERFATATVQAERVLGTSAEKIAKNFAELGRDPVGGVRKLNAEIHFLTIAQFEQIRSLEAAGKATDAAKLAQDLYANALQNRTGEMVGNIGSIERGWIAVKDAVGGATEAVLGIGRLPSAEERLEELLAQQKRNQVASGVIMRNGKVVSGQTSATDADEPIFRQGKQVLNEQQLLASKIASLRVTVEQNKAAKEALATSQKANDAAIKATENVKKAKSEAALTTDDSIRDAVQALAEFNTRLRDQIAVLGLSEDAALEYRLTFGDLADEVAAAGPLGVEYANSIIAQAREVRAAKEAQDAFNKSIADRNSLLKEAKQFEAQVAGQTGSIRSDDGTYAGIDKRESQANGENSRFLDSQLAEADRLKESLTDSTATQLNIWRNYEEQRTQIARAAEEARHQLTRQYLDAGVDALGNAAFAAQALGKKGFEAFKALSIAQTIIKTYEGAQSAYTSLASVPFVGPVLGAGAAAAAVAAGLARVGQIKSLSYSAGFESGGYTGDGGRQQVAGVVHGKEFVVNAAATQRNRGLLESLNAGGRAGAPNISINLINNNGQPLRATVGSVSDDGEGGISITAAIDAFDSRLNDNTSRTSRILSGRTGIKSRGSIG